MTGGTDFAFARKQRARLGWCVLLVACAHLTLLVPSPAAVARTAAAATPRTLHVRLLHYAALPAATPPAAPVSPGGTGMVPLAERYPAPAATNHAVASSKTRSSQGDTASAMRRPADEDYLPRSALTVAPRSLAAVLVDYPYFDGESDQYTGEFDLFIDDNGGVVRVANATPALPGILAMAVREAFLAARFSPGEIEGRPVRSRMRIEVTFDSRRLPSS
jgi:protein TonB